MKRRKKGSRKNIKGRKLTPKELRYNIMLLFGRSPKKHFNPKQVIKTLKIDNNAPAVLSAMERLTKENKLVALDGYKFKLNKYASETESAESYEGRVDMTRSGSAYIVSDELANDVFVSSKDLNSAQDGDKVKVVVTRSNNRRSEGIVIEVVERATESFIGTLHLSSKFGFVEADRNTLSSDIFIPLADVNEAKDGDKVVVKVVDWSEGVNKKPVGKVMAVLSGKNHSDLTMKTILVDNGFDLTFPEEVVKEAHNLDTTLSEEEIARRRDMRTTTTFTIDPDTAKDFDDALSVKWLENGHIEIGVHIADVAHYVKPDTALDKEAFYRSTSVYLVDRVSPMLPEELSNGLCSLRPNEDKCTFSAVFEFDKDDKIVSRWFGRTLTHSDRRFTYGEAQEVLEIGEGDFVNELKTLNRVAHKLRKAKFKNGAIAFEAPEVKFKLDEEGRPVSVYTKERKDAHLLIEDFMLLANKEVAQYISEKGRNEGKEIPGVYRVHDSPDPGKLADFATFAAGFGYQLDISSPQGISKSLNKLAKDAKERSELKMLEPMAIRTMAKAVYTTNNIGHYGLAFEYYSHFTSPIRRYSDVLTHRILAANLDGKTKRWDKTELEEQCKYISKQERKAMTAERESIKYKQVEFLKDKVGETFEGIISGMIDKGFFVEILENKCEGMVPFDTLSERYVIQEGRLTAKSVVSDAVMKIGDVVQVVIMGADLNKRRIDMELVEE